MATGSGLNALLAFCDYHIRSDAQSTITRRNAGKIVVESKCTWRNLQDPDKKWQTEEDTRLWLYVFPYKCQWDFGFRGRTVWTEQNSRDSCTDQG